MTWFARRKPIQTASLWAVVMLLFVELLVSGVSSSASDDLSSAKSHRRRHALGEYDDESGFYQSITITEDSPLLKTRSSYQEIEVHRSEFYGKVLVLDGVLQLTERDANAYNEMMAHIPMFQHAYPKRVLIIGGGDGYVLSEILKHKSVEHVDHVDLDGEVIQICQKEFPWGKAWSDPRVKLHVADGAKFVRDAASESYDVIVQDSSDPWSTDKETGEKVVLPSSVLYEEKHFHNLHRILKPNGILNLQAETFTLPSDIEGIVYWRQQALRVGFESARYGSLYISSYPTGQIGFLMCEKSPTAATKSKEILHRYRQMVASGSPTSYYHARLQRSSFELPLWVHERIYGSWSDEGTLCVEDEESLPESEI